MFSRFFACFLATFLANGLARFGVVALIPLMISSEKLTKEQSYLIVIAILMAIFLKVMF